MKIAEQCVGKIKLPKRLIKEGVDGRCHNIAYEVCPDCKGYYCHYHINRGKHECISSILEEKK